MAAQGGTETDSRDVALTIPAQADYLVLARLALSAVCRLTPLSPEEVADLKLAITEAASDFVHDGPAPAGEERVGFAFKLSDDRLLVELTGNGRPVPEGERELSRAIIDATVDESAFERGRTRLMKRLAGQRDG